MSKVLATVTFCNTPGLVPQLKFLVLPEEMIPEEFFVTRTVTELTRNAIDSKRREKEIYLLASIRRDDQSMVKFYLDNGADVHFGDDEALFWAARFCKPDMIKLLLQYGANIKKGGYKALQTIDDIEMATFLLQNGATFQDGPDKALESLQNSSRSIAVELAAFRGDIKMIKLLLKYGADVSLNRDMPLIQAITGNKIEMVRFLLKQGANPRAQNGYPLELAKKNNLTEIAQLLREYGA